MVSRDGINGVSTSYSNFVPSLQHRQKRIFFNALPDGWRENNRAAGTGSRFRNLRFAQFLCVAQELGKQ
jgi:hypothetical protein